MNLWEPGTRIRRNRELGFGEPMNLWELGTRIREKP